jgi:stress-induced morphogen
MTRAERIHHALQHLAPLHLEVLNESHKHSGSATETHYRVVVVSAAFESQNRVARHRSINALVRAEFDTGLHALAIEAVTAEQWAAAGGAQLQSPNCMGG